MGKNSFIVFSHVLDISLCLMTDNNELITCSGSHPANQFKTLWKYLFYLEKLYTKEKGRRIRNLPCV